MTDAELVAALRTIFSADDPADGIDRSDGYGDEYTIDVLDVVTGDDGFDDLVVRVDRGGEHVTARLLFDREWRVDSGLDEPAAYAAFVVARWEASLVGDPAPAGDEPSTVAPTDLELELRRTYGNANRLRHDLVEVVEDDGEIFFVQVTPQEWHRFQARRPEAVAELDDTISARWDDEDHIVFFRGRFHRSVRSELPPVRSMLLRESS